MFPLLTMLTITVLLLLPVIGALCIVCLDHFLQKIVPPAVSYWSS